MGGTREWARSGGRAASILVVLGLLILWAAPAQAAVTIQAFATADRTTVDPGDLVTYTLSMNSQGPNAAMRVWANVTLPSMTYVSDTSTSLPSFAGTWSSGDRRYYNFTNVPVGNHTFTLRARVNVGPGDGAVLAMPFRVNYTDEAGVRQTELIAVRSVTVRIPVVSVTMTPSATSVDPGDSLSFKVSVSNTGNATARDIWLNDTLPTEVTLDRVVPGGFCAGLNCTVTNLGAGKSRAFEIFVLVGMSVPRGTMLTNRISVSYTDDDGTLLASSARQATVEVRVVRDLLVDKVVDASLAFPGADVAFTIWYNNTAGGDVQDVWVNDTLPAGLAFVAASPAASVNGSMVQWRFATVGPGPHAAALTARVDSGALDGTVLANRVAVDYLDASGQRAPRANGSASLTVSVNIPRFDTFTKLADRATVDPGGTVTYTLWYNNTGVEAASRVVIRDTIPAGTVLTNPSATPTVTNRTYEWTFTNVTVGSHSLTYVLVLQDVAPDTNLVNFASLLPTDASGRPLPPVPPRSAIVRVSGVAGSVLPLALLLVVAVAGSAGALYYLRRPRTVIDEVFLLHKDGLLIKHYTRRVRPDMDSDVLSGMLIAVQNFVNESFMGSEGLDREGRLDELRFGEFKIVIERGQWVTVAAALSGDPTDRVKGEVQAAIEALEGALGPRLDGWSGDMRSVEGADRYMQDLIAGRYGRNRWGKG